MLYSITLPLSLMIPLLCSITQPLRAITILLYPTLITYFL